MEGLVEGTQGIRGKKKSWLWNTGDWTNNTRGNVSQIRDGFVVVEELSGRNLKRALRIGNVSG